MWNSLGGTCCGTDWVGHVVEQTGWDMLWNRLDGTCCGTDWMGHVVEQTGWDMWNRLGGTCGIDRVGQVVE